MNAILIGNYGAGNAGDQALKDYFISAYPDVGWTVLSAMTEEAELPRLPTGIRSLFRPWWRTLSAIRRADAVVFGGGSLFTDVESVRAPIIWGLHALVAVILGTPVILAFQGVGPLRSGIGKSITRFVLRHAAFVSVRDQESLAMCTVLWRREVFLAADPAVLRMPTTSGFSSHDSFLALIPRATLDTDFVEALKYEHAFEKEEAVHILLMQPGHPLEREMAERLRVLVSTSKVCEAPTLSLLCSNLMGAKHVVSARYHGALSAFMMGIPLTIVSQGQTDKLDSLRKFIREGGTPEALRTRAEEGEKALRSVLCA